MADWKIKDSELIGNKHSQNLHDFNLFGNIILICHCHSQIVILYYIFKDLLTLQIYIVLSALSKTLLRNF
jgi:hypothetical protein